MYSRIKLRLSSWDRYDSNKVLFAVIGTLVGLGSVFAGAPTVLGVGVGLLVHTVLTALV